MGTGWVLAAARLAPETFPFWLLGGCRQSQQASYLLLNGLSDFHLFCTKVSVI